jgi:hypothetical protein
MGRLRLREARATGLAHSAAMRAAACAHRDRLGGAALLDLPPDASDYVVYLIGVFSVAIWLGSKVVKEMSAPGATRRIGGVVPRPGHPGHLALTDPIAFLP